MILQMVVIFFRRPILTVGLFLLIGGSAGFAGRQADAFAGYRIAEGSAAALVTLMGLVLVIWDLIRYFRSEGGPREQRWEPVVDDGIVQAINGNWDGATAQFQKAMEMAGPDPRKLHAAERIGGYLESRSKVSAAIPYLHTALAIRYRMFGTSDIATRVLMERLSGMYRSVGDPAGAAQLLAAELDVLAPGGRVITVEAARVASKLAEVTYETGDLTAAHELSQKAIAAIEQGDPYSSALVDALVVSARSAAATGSIATAESQLNRAMECADRSGSGDKMNVVRKRLIDLYSTTGRFAEAIPLSAKLLQAGTSSTKGPDMNETMRMNRQHADLLEHAGRSQEAAKFRRIADTLESLNSSSSQAHAPA